MGTLCSLESLLVCGISLTSGQLVSELLPDCTRSCFSQVVLHRRGGDSIYVCLFVCGISLTSGQLINELFPDCTRSCFSQVVSRRRGGDRIYEMRCLFVAVGPNARFIVCLFVCGISLTSGQLSIELFPDCTRSCFLQVVSRHRGGDRIYEMRCLFVTVGLNARFIVLPHWDNMSQAHMLTHPVTLY